MSNLSPKEIDKLTKKLKQVWKINQQILKRKFLFSTYKSSIIFVNAVAQLAEKHNHHPSILIDYCKVLIQITTHDAGNNLTKKDFDLAASIEQIVKL